MVAHAWIATATLTLIPTLNQTHISYPSLGSTDPYLCGGRCWSICHCARVLSLMYAYAPLLIASPGGNPPYHNDTDRSQGNQKTTCRHIHTQTLSLTSACAHSPLPPRSV